MAILTVLLDERTDANGNTCRWSYQWNDVSFRLTQISCVNLSMYNSRFTATSTTTGDVIAFSCTAGAALTQNIPTGQANQFGLSLDARGRVNGVSWSVEWGPFVPGAP